MTAEHAWPEWLDEELPLSGTVTFVHTPPDGKTHIRARSVLVRDVKVKRVCGRCNHGWMSDLEGAVKPILRPMLKGLSRTLNESEQRILATWAVKTAWMLEYLDSMVRRPVPLDHYEYLKTHQEPPPNTHVFAAGYVGSKWANYYWMQTLRLPTKEPETPPPPHGYYSTLCIGQVVLQVVGISLPDFKLIQTAPDVFLQIWPFDGQVMWPGRLILDDAALEHVARAPLFGLS